MCECVLYNHVKYQTMNVRVHKYHHRSIMYYRKNFSCKRDSEIKKKKRKKERS